MHKTIPQIILEQMGGVNRLSAMIGAKHFFSVKEGRGLQFKFKGSREANFVEIVLNSLDTYDVTFKRIHGLQVTEVAHYGAIYAENLRELFENTTKLYLSL